MKKLLIFAALLFVSANCFAISSYHKKLIDDQFEKNKNEQMFSFSIDRIDSYNGTEIGEYLARRALAYKFTIVDIYENGYKSDGGVISVILAKSK